MRRHEKRSNGHHDQIENSQQERVRHRIVQVRIKDQVNQHRRRALHQFLVGGEVVCGSVHVQQQDGRCALSRLVVVWGDVYARRSLGFFLLVLLARCGVFG